MGTDIFVYDSWKIKLEAHLVKCHNGDLTNTFLGGHSVNISLVYARTQNDQSTKHE